MAQRSESSGRRDGGPSEGFARALGEGAGEPLLYTELAGWWPLVSRPADYADEAAFFQRTLVEAARGPVERVLELGCGGGNTAFHLKRHFAMTLTDVSPAMVKVSRGLNPECEHMAGDMRTLRLGRTFDAVFIHDAIMYLTAAADVQAALATAAAHCREGGAVLIVPDFVRERFEGGTSHGGHDGEDGRAVRFLQWTHDPDPSDCGYTVDFAFLLREGDGRVRAVSDRHVCGLFGRDAWLGWLEEAGFSARVVVDDYGREVFAGAFRLPS